MKRGLALFAMLVLLVLPLSPATPVLSRVEGAQGPAGGPPPPLKQLPPRERDGQSLETRPWGLPETTAEMAQPTSLNWHIEYVDDPKGFSNMGQRSLALDASGHPHIAYGGGDHLYYAWHDGIAWHLETVDASGGVGSHTSLALDTSGRPHISYYDYTHRDLKYAHFDGTVWLTETVDSAGYVGPDTSLALDSAGRPHISYSDQYPNYDLKYAHFDGSAWLTETVDSAGWVGRYNSLALDASGRPHISYRDHTNRYLKYAWGECVLVTGASIAGPTLLPVGQTGLYTATSTPPTATLVTLTWDNGSVGPTAAYSWTLPGSYTLIVTATNPCGQVSTSFTVEVCQPVEEVDIAGPALLPVEQTGLYTATTTPPTATLPITFTWDNGTISNTAAFSWTVPGTQTIAVTASNACSGPISDTFEVFIVCEAVQIVTVTTEISDCVVTFGADLLGDPPLTYRWTFGDGMTDTAAMPAHDYGTSGTYSGTLEVWNCAGGGYAEQPFVVTVDCAPPGGYRIFLPLVLSRGGFAFWDR